MPDLVSAADDLVRCGLGQWCRGPDGTESFEFKHSTLLWCFAARRMLSAEWPITAAELLLDRRWTAIAEVIIERGSDAMVQKVVDAANCCCATPVARP